MAIRPEVAVPADRTASPLARRDVWSGAALLAVGGAIALSAADLGIGGLSQPGPGFLGFHVGLAILTMGIAVLIGAWRDAAAPSLGEMFAGMRRAPAMIVPMLAFCLVLERIGFLIAGFLLMWWLFAVSFGTIRSIRPVLYSLAATGATWLLFNRLLGSDLPPVPF